LAALDINYQMVKSLRADVRIATKLGDRRGINGIYRQFIKTLTDTIDLLGYSELNNPPEPLIEFEKLKRSFQIHQETISSLLSDQPGFTDDQHIEMSRRAQVLNVQIRKRAKRHLRYFERYFPDFLTAE